MKIEELKKACDVLSNAVKCHKNDDCDGECDTCSYNFSEEEYDEALDTAITVIGDVVKQMERIKKDNHEEVLTNGIYN